MKGCTIGNVQPLLLYCDLGVLRERLRCLNIRGVIALARNVLHLNKFGANIPRLYFHVHDHKHVTSVVASAPLAHWQGLRCAHRLFTGRDDGAGNGGPEGDFLHRDAP